jgi:hypothetical protein
MGINVFPYGVGPQNSDIAAAVAAPSAATIAAAVAAPSAATIATQVAASVPTLSQINTAVSNNASPYGGTWANITSASPGGASNVTLSSLSGYKYLLVFCALQPSTNLNYSVRVNGDTAANYAWYINNASGGSDTSSSSTFGQIMPNNGGAAGGFLLEIPGANSTTQDKIIRSHFGSGNGNANSVTLWKNTAAISSLSIICSNGSFSGYIRVLGAN